MRKFRIRIVLLISQSFFLLSSSPAFASGDQPVNCRDVVVDQQPIYGGLSVCYYTHPTGQIFRIEENVVPNIYRFRELSRIGQLYSGSNIIVKCTATVPFPHYLPITNRICDYTPSAVVASHTSAGSGVLRINDSSTDRDGSIVRRELWLNGNKVIDTTNGIDPNQGWNFPFGSLVNVRLKVTDNQGYTDEVTTSRYMTSGNEGGGATCADDPHGDECV